MFMNSLEGVVHDQDACRFRGHVVVLATRRPCRGSHYGRGVVDIVAHIERLGFRGFGANTRKFLFGTLLSVEFGDS
jgi:hypothetical protein